MLDFTDKNDLNQQSFTSPLFVSEHSNELLPIQVESRKVANRSSIDKLRAGTAAVTNDDFLFAIFGDSFTATHPLVCKKSGDPALGGWPATKWPCNTN